MSRGTSRRALVVTALIGFVVGIGVSLRSDLLSRSEAISLFGSGEQQAPDAAAVQRAIEGNLCRCTGYKKIVEAIVDAGQALAAREQR